MANIINARDRFLQAGTRTTAFALVVSNTVTKYGIEIGAINTSSTIVSSYTFKLGSNFSTAVTLAVTGSPVFTWDAQAPGIYTVWCVAKDINNNESTPANTVVTITAPGYSEISGVITGPNLKLTWTISQSDFVIDRYELRYGNTWDTGVVVATTYSTTYTQRVEYLGSRIWWVAGINIAGKYSTPTAGVNIVINAPNSVSNVQASVVDNNVLLSWTEPAIGQGQLPVASYAVKKGTAYSSSTPVGSNGNSNFTSIFEQAGGKFTYWIVPVDTAGNSGSPFSTVVDVNQPPDYILRNNYNSSFTAGTSTNFYIEKGALIGPVNTAQTWQSHFADRNWSSPQQQINSGFPIYATPSLTTGTYEEVIDYDTSIPPTVITCTITAEAVVGVVSNTCVISYKLSGTDPWTVLPTGTTALLPVFRYVRVQFTFTAAAGSNLVKINNLNIKLAIKQRTDSGTAVYNSASTDAQNTVLFSYPFVYADTPIVQANNTNNTQNIIIPVVIYNGSLPNPTGFSVRLYTVGGALVSSSYSWSVRGY